ncbi:MAG: hypothetical protein KAJ63_00015 [Methyloprofundus sp.]|nr:hypothetical protein [Methyloprofundus sp.]
MMKKYTPILLLTSLGFFLSSPLISAGSISGQVEAPARVKKIIIYLSPENTEPLNTVSIEHGVEQKDTRFSTPLVVMVPGDSIAWTNNETKEIDHNIFSLSPLQRFDLGLGAKGSTLTQVFDKKGVLNYYCSVHKEMEGKVVILPSRYFQLLEQPGKFKIDNIPNGKWTLKTFIFHRRYKSTAIKLIITDDSVENLSINIIKR